MSGQETGGQELRERIVSAVRTHAIDSARNDRAQDADYCLCGVLVEDWDEHWTDAALTLVQPELDAKDAQIAEQRAENAETVRMLQDQLDDLTRRHIAVEAERDRLRTWPGLMETLAQHYPPDVIDGSSGDPGPQIVALAREVDRLRKAAAADQKGGAGR